MSTDTEILQDESTIVTFKPPSMWKVVFLNDDKTPMEFVIDLLIELFGHDEKSAHDITLEIHNTGSGVAGIYNYEIAEQKGLEATRISKVNGHPLKIQVEQE